MRNLFSGRIEATPTLVIGLAIFCVVFGGLAAYLLTELL
jgi:hypothetical protein